MISAAVVVAQRRRGGGRDRNPPPPDGIGRRFHSRPRRDLCGLFRRREVFEAEDVEGGRGRGRARRHPRRDNHLRLSPRIGLALFEAAVVHLEVLGRPRAGVAAAEDGGERGNLAFGAALASGKKIVQADNDISSYLELKSRDRIVVSTLRCGRSNPGSNPGHGSTKC